MMKSGTSGCLSVVSVFKLVECVHAVGYLCCLRSIVPVDRYRTARRIMPFWQGC